MKSCLRTEHKCRCVCQQNGCLFLLCSFGSLSQIQNHKHKVELINVKTMAQVMFVTCTLFNFTLTSGYFLCLRYSLMEGWKYLA